MPHNDIENGDIHSKNSATVGSPTPHYFSIPITAVRDINGNVGPSHLNFDARPSTSLNSGQYPDEDAVRHTYGSVDIRQPTKRRKSIFDQPIGSFKGPNSISKFASSFQRANSFKTIEIPHDRERSFFRDGTDETFDPNTLTPSMHGRRLSVILNSTQHQPENSDAIQRYGYNSLMADQSVFDDRDSNFSAVVSNHGSNSIYPANSISQDIQSIMLKKYETKEGTTVVTIAGQSTVPQTIFNSVNVLIGIGLLALPLGLSYAGWYLGLPMLLLFAASTFCTAELLSRCMNTDPTLISYGDLGYAAFGPRGRALISILFAMDVLGAGVALFILFGDSLNALFPSHSVTFYKICGLFIICPQSFLPLHILSHVSLLGIMSTIGTVVLIVACGFLKNTSPGSLIEPMSNNVWPASFQNFCLSIGLLCACWGGHPIFPNLKSDMRHPGKFKDCLKATYLITALTDIGAAVIGFLMFGNTVLDEVTKSVLLTQGYPSFIYIIISGLMSIIPIAKTPLSAIPIISILDSIMGATKDTFEDNEKLNHISNSSSNFNGNDEQDSLLASNSSFVKPRSGLKKKMIRWSNKILINVIFLITSIFFPDFDKLLAFVGAGLCFLICFILPCFFYLIICKNTIKRWEVVACWITIVISAILSILGVGAAIMS